MSRSSNGSRYDVLIIGSGPAGWTAAVYAARANLKTVLFTGLQAGGSPGGQLMLTSEVENYPGFDDGILGPELMDRMRRQALRFGVELVEDDVTRVDFRGRPLTAFTGADEDETDYQAKTVIIATGASALWLGLPSETRLRGRGVSSCATCDGFFFRNQDVAVIGGGDTALEEAIYLTRHAAKVTIVHRRGDLRASKIMQDRARANPKIAWALHQDVVDILGDERVEGIALRDARTGATSVLAVSGVFVAIGHRPNTDLFRGQIDLDLEGYVVTTAHTATNVPGVFVAGDVHDRRYRQAVTAAGEGCQAALDAEEYITGEIWTDWSMDEGETIAEEVERFIAESTAPAVPAQLQPIAAASVDAEPEPEQPRVRMYTTSWCPDCFVAKRYLRQLGVDYEEIDIEETPGAAELVETWSGGYRTVPTFVIGDAIVVDFDRKALDRALAVA
ncbi:MAG: thioredoxin reductase [Thermomicrobiales bacterium]|jgi:thioredoxin reductase (NADPH)|nr:thioredoxin reductase [Thermomicrobiales bacterium]